MNKFSRLTIDSLLLVLLMAILILPISTVGILKLAGTTTESEVLSVQDDQAEVYEEGYTQDCCSEGAAYPIEYPTEEDSVIFEIAGEVEEGSDTVEEVEEDENTDEINEGLIQQMRDIEEPSP
jgi:hypothetical protein